jgi:hypothetical protein
LEVPVVNWDFFFFARKNLFRNQIRNQKHHAVYFIHQPSAACMLAMIGRQGKTKVIVKYCRKKDLEMSTTETTLVVRK